jgi:hypothetical protein
MEIIATIMTGIYWGLIIDACWIIPYFGLLFYHFFMMENDPAYAMRYDQANRLVKRAGVKEAVIQESQFRVVKMQFWLIVGMIKGFFKWILKTIKEAARRKN